MEISDRCKREADSHDVPTVVNLRRSIIRIAEYHVVDRSTLQDERNRYKTQARAHAAAYEANLNGLMEAVVVKVLPAPPVEEETNNV